MGKRHGWVKESENVYSEGIYYKSNQAIILTRIKTVVQRGTYTGREKTLGRFPTKEKARKFMLSFVRQYPSGTMPQSERM